MTRILLIGNPNSGKTTLFNALTGHNQRVGNWPGVTVEKKTGELFSGGQQVSLVDLPGVYSLVVDTEGLSQDEQITAHSIVTMEWEAIINVVDACHLERHLYLTSQILEWGKPVIVALNMMDIAKQRGISIDVQALESKLSCPVIPIQAHKNKGLSALVQVLLELPQAPTPWTLSLDSEVQQKLIQEEEDLIHQGYPPKKAHYYARRLAEAGKLDSTREVASPTKPDWGLDVVLADARYSKIHETVNFVQKKSSDASDYFTAKVDRIVLHRFWALPLFFAVMYLMFWFAINLGGVFQDFFDVATDTIFVQKTAWLLQQWQAPAWLIGVLANGLGKGINTTLTFIPVIAAMFFFLSFLEVSGYMARAAFVVDKVMRVMGLPGKAFVPMIVGFGCNVPAIMAARTLDSERDRLLTVMMSPFMSCSARLAIYAVFVAAFFPTGGQNVVFSLYLIGILMAVGTGFLLRKTLLKGQTSPLILELPPYHRPTIKRLLKETSLRLRYFVFRAGKLIIPVCVLLGGLNAITLDGSGSLGGASTQSLLSMMGQWITPLFAPMGIHQDNWPATVGLLTGMLAKEVVVGTLNSLYAQLGALHQAPIGLSVYGIMCQRFAGPAGAYAYLLFVLLYIPCVSTMAVIRQETNKQWMWLSIVWSVVIAYLAAVIFYQTALWWQHAESPLFWVIGIPLGLISIFSLYYFPKKRKEHAFANT